MKKAGLPLLVLYLFACQSVGAQSAAPFLYETGWYKIHFPAQFEKSARTVASELGPLQMSIVACEPQQTSGDSNFVYMLIETTYPDSTIHSDKQEILEEFFEGSIKGAEKNINGKIIRVTKGMTGLYPDRTLEMDYQNGVALVKMKMILVNSTVIIIQTITPTAYYPNTAGNRFFSSFILK